MLLWIYLFCFLLPLSSSSDVTYVQYQPKIFDPQLISQGFSVAISADGTTFVVGAPIYANGTVLIYSLDTSSQTFVQQGPPLVGSDVPGIPGTVDQGYSVAISGDGSTVISGGLYAAWVFTRNNSGSWNQQGPPLVGLNSADFGWSAALDFYGNTALISSPSGDDYTGAAWFFTRNITNGHWSQQSPTLVGEKTNSKFGYASTLSANGSLAVISAGVAPTGNFGALYIYTLDKSLGTWNLKNMISIPYIVKTSNPFPPYGPSVSLSNDEQTILVGTPWVDDYIGASWVFNYNASNDTWYQQTKLVGTYTPFMLQGISVSLSSDGTYALIGGPNANDVGGAWIFTRDSFGNWNQVGETLIGNDENGTSELGFAVSLSGNAMFAIIGGPTDNPYPAYTPPNYSAANVGATWVFRSISTSQSPSGSPTTSNPTTSPSKILSAKNLTDSPTQSPTSPPGLPAVIPFTGVTVGDPHYILLNGTSLTCNSSGMAILISSPNWVAFINQVASSPVSLIDQVTIQLTSSVPTTKTYVVTLSSNTFVSEVLNAASLFEIQITSPNQITLPGFRTTFLLNWVNNNNIDVIVNTADTVNGGILLNGCSSTDIVNINGAPAVSACSTLMQPYESFCNYDISSSSSSQNITNQANIAAQYTTIQTLYLQAANITYPTGEYAGISANSFACGGSSFSYTAYPDGCFNLPGEVNVSNVIYSSVYFHCENSNNAFVELFTLTQCNGKSQTFLQSTCAEPVGGGGGPSTRIYCVSLK